MAVPRLGAPKSASSVSWDLPPHPLQLDSTAVHVWRAALTLDPSAVQALQQLLSPDEQIRAEQFYFSLDREHFIVARGLLRVILGRYLDRDPRRLRFSYNPHGKPALVKEESGEEISFNLSHAHGLALYAIARGRNVGIDLEYLRSDLVHEQIAEHFFSPREVASLLALPPSLRMEAFFNCWTRKEAYIKARGEGLSLPLDQFTVSLIPGVPAALLHTECDPREAFSWSLRELVPGPGYVAALAVESQEWQLCCWQWDASSYPGTM